MKILVLIARVLLGLIFTIFGLNGFLHFIPMSPPPGLAGQFLSVLVQSHYTVPVSGLQLAGGILLILNRWVPLALTLLGPIIVNILLFHILMAPEGLPLAIIVTALWFIVFARVRGAFAGLFASPGKA